MGRSLKATTPTTASEGKDDELTQSMTASSPMPKAFHPKESDTEGTTPSGVQNPRERHRRHPPLSG
eukprot:504363-Amphidinium_carterae.1